MPAFSEALRAAKAGESCFCGVGVTGAEGVIGPRPAGAAGETCLFSTVVFGTFGVVLIFTVGAAGLGVSDPFVPSLFVLRRLA